MRTRNRVRVRVCATSLVAAVALAAAAASADGAVYWTSTQSQGIGRVNLDGSHVERQFISTTSSSAGLAVDDAHLYWGGVARANLDGSAVNDTFIPHGGSGGVAVNGQHLYWGRYGGSTEGWIARANLDGTGVDEDFISGVAGPCGLAVDGSYLYWASVNNGTIGRARLDGTEVDHAFITPMSGFAPCGVAVDDDHVYWASYWNGGTTIGRADLDGSDVDDEFISGANYPCGVAVDDTHIYWANQFGPEAGIGRAKLDGSDVDQSFVDLSDDLTIRPCGVAVDALQASTTTIAASSNSISYGQPVTITATVSGAEPTPTGSVRFLVNRGGPYEHTGAPVPLDADGKARYPASEPLDVGLNLSVEYGGDAHHVSSRSGDAALTVAPAFTATRVATAPNPVISGEDVDVDIAVSNASSSLVPVGSVQFSVDGFPLGPPDPLDEDGRVAFTLVGDVPAGEYRLSASYLDPTMPFANFLASEGSVLQRVVDAPGPPAVAAPAAPAAPASRARVSRRDLARLSRRLVKALRLRGFAALRSAQRFTASAPGTLSQRISASQGRRGDAPARRRVLVAAGAHTFAAAGPARLRLRLTAAGRRLTRRARRLRVEISSRFRQRDGTTVAVVNRLTLTRRGSAKARSSEAHGWRLGSGG